MLSGMSDVPQVEDNVKTFTEYQPLEESQKKLLMEACELFRPAVAIPCTSCRYCCNDCPKGLDIPGMLSVYNEVKLDDVWRISFLGNLPEDKQLGACVACGSCKKHSPQNIDIPAHIAELNGLNEQMMKMIQAQEADDD